jgi:UTP-glucose-1-phosphate uridylyltransferase
MKPTLLILAAGMGSRYGGLKQMDQLGPGGETIIDYSIYDAINAGFGKVVLVVRESIREEMSHLFDARWADKIDLQYAIQEVNIPVAGIENLPHREKPWGTAHAVMVAKDKINEPFAVINADDFYGTEAYLAVHDFLVNKVNDQTYAMAGYILKNTLSEHGSVSRGVTVTDSNSNLQSITERTKIQRAGNQIVYVDEQNQQLELNNESFVSMNFWAFSTGFFAESEAMFRQFVVDNPDNPKAEFYIPLVIETLMKEDKVKVKVLENRAKWMGVTYQEDRPVVVAKLKQLADEGKYPVGVFK